MFSEILVFLQQKQLASKFSNCIKINRKQSANGKNMIKWLHVGVFCAFPEQFTYIGTLPLLLNRSKIKAKILLFQGIVNTKVHLMRCYVEYLGLSLSHCIPLMFFAQPLLCKQISKMFKELLEPLFRCKGEEQNNKMKKILLIPRLT